jgi:putative ABC transport system permease protein
MREWLARLRDRLRRGKLDAELAEEMRFHRNQLERDARAAGASAAEARHSAARQLGNETVARESARERWSVPSLEAILRDTRYAFRGLARSPGFTATVAITLALGIGANVAMFGVVDRLMFRPLAYLRDPGTVHRVYWQWNDRTEARITRTGAYRRYLDIRENTTSFSHFAAFSERDVAVGEGESSRERRIGAVNASFFSFFDARPALGRFFTPDEDVTPRGADVVVLSHDLWQSEFGGRDVLGEILVVGDMRAQVIGVAPPGFNGVNDAAPPALWVPITSYAASTGTTDSRTYFSTYSWGWVNILVRRKPDVPVEDASADATRALLASWRSEGQADPNLQPVDFAKPRAIVAAVRPGAGPNPALEERTMVWVSAVAVLVLLIACANVANLILARSLRRRREIAVRLALGVSRARLAMQSVIECTLLALLGGALAVLVAQWGGQALVRAPAGMSVLTDWRSLVVAFAVTLTIGLVVGLVPALLAGRSGDLAGSLRGGARTGARDGGRIRAALLVVQASLAVTLLVGAALFVRSLQAVKGMRMGYDAERVVLVNRIIRGMPMNDSTQIPLRARLLETAQSLPDVEAAAWVNSAPFVSTSSTNVFVQGIDSTGRLGVFTYQATSPDYFRVMGTRILRGRGISAEDRLGAPNIIVLSESMARVLWPGRDALGACVVVWRADQPCRTVVGIAEDMVQNNLADGTRYHFYMPIEQFTRTWGNGMLLKLRGDPAEQGERVRAELQRVMPGASYLTMRPLEGIVDVARRSWQLGATMFVAFGVLALVVAAVGLYGVIAYNVAQRTNELGVRVALGAQRAHLLRLVVGESVRFTLAGVGVGLVVATASGRWVQPLLFGQSARDPVVYGGVGLLMLAVALAASALPALKASRTDPASALRAE